MTRIRDAFYDLLDYVRDDLVDDLLEPLRTGEDIQRRGTRALVEVTYIEDGDESEPEQWRVSIPFLHDPPEKLLDPDNWLDRVNIRSKLRRSFRGYEGETVRVKFLECKLYPELKNQSVEWIEKD